MSSADDNSDSPAEESPTELRPQQNPRRRLHARNRPVVHSTVDPPQEDGPAGQSGSGDQEQAVMEEHNDAWQYWEEIWDASAPAILIVLICFFFITLRFFYDTFRL